MWFDTEEVCTRCNGSGEGQFDGAVCTRCHGRGTALSPEEEYERQLDRAEHEYDLKHNR